MAYTKQTWSSNDLVTAEKLNHIEEGVASSIPKIAGTNDPIGRIGGGGENLYCKIATIEITAAYVDYPIVFEISGRDIEFSLISLMFESLNGTDPSVESFTSSNYTNFWIKKEGTSTWVLYGGYRDSAWGYIILHRIIKNSSGVTVTVNMENVGNDQPSEAIKATNEFLKKSAGGTLNGYLTMRGKGIALRPEDSSTDATGGISWYYGDDTKPKMRIDAKDDYTSKAGPSFHVYSKNGTALWQGDLPLSDGTGASGTWGINISGSAANATQLGSRPATGFPMLYTASTSTAGAITVTHPELSTDSSLRKVFLAYGDGGSGNIPWAACIVYGTTANVGPYVKVVNFGDDDTCQVTLINATKFKITTKTYDRIAIISTNNVIDSVETYSDT